MSKLDEIRNRLKKDSEGGSLLDRYAASTKTSLNKPQSKDVGVDSISFDDIESDEPVTLQAHKRAIFIGNDKYIHGRPLSKCVNDARAMQHIFSKIGYRIVFDFDLGSEKMHKLFERFKDDIEEGDELVLNYSGHGIQINSEIYLAPVDVELSGVQDISLLVNLDKEMDEMLARGAKIVVAIVDACRNQERIDYQTMAENSYMAGVQDALKMGESAVYKQSQKSSGSIENNHPVILQGKAILFSSSHDTSSTEWDDMANGLFTHYFIKEVVKPGRTITQVIERVRDLVRDESIRRNAVINRPNDPPQIPAFHNNLPGDYYFIDPS